MNINDIVTKKSNKPFKGGSKLDVIEKLTINEQSPKKDIAAYLKYSKTIVSLNKLFLIKSQPNDYIYLISTDRHKDSIDFECYCITEEEIKTYVINYYKNFFNQKVRNIIIDFQNNIINFEVLDFADDWEKSKLFLNKIKKIL